MKSQNVKDEEDTLLFFKPGLKAMIVVISLAPLLALIPYVMKKAHTTPTCEDMEREFYLADLNMKPNREALRAEYISKCEKPNQTQH